MLAKPRLCSLGGDADWSAILLSHLERRKQLRREMTPPERKLWQVLRGEQLGVKFRRQHPIWPHIADFYRREACLVVEVDAAAAHSGEAAVAYDQTPDAYIQALGLRVLRIPPSEMERNVHGVFEAVRDACREQTDPAGAKWIRSADLYHGDTLFFCPDRIEKCTERIMEKFSEEEVYDLEVDSAYSFLTEVCAIHNCGSGTALAVAEKLGRRWIGVDLGCYAIHTTRKRLIQAQGRAARCGPTLPLLRRL